MEREPVMRRTSAERIFENLSPEAQRSVSSSLHRAEIGFKRDLVTPLCDKENPTESRDLRIAEVRSWLLPTGYEWLDEVEEDRLAEIGPKSIMLPYDQRKEQVYKYFTQQECQVTEDELRYAIASVAALVPSKLVPVAVETAFQALPKRTNQGYPYFQKGKLQEIGSLTLAREILISRRLNFIPPAMLYWRGQSRGPHEIPKQRTVWGYAHHIILIEEMFQLAILQALRNLPEFAAWNHPSRVNQVITEIFDTAQQPILSVDFSGYDASLPKVLIHAAFEVVRSWFSTEWHDLIHIIEESFLTCGLWTPEGILGGRDGGVPSGSGFTNLIDSLCQLLGLRICEYRLHNPVVLATVQGDDGVYSFSKPWALSELQEVFESLGLKLSSDKGGISMSVVYYLQNVYHTDLRINGVIEGFRPLGRAYGGMFDYERLHKPWTPADDSIRWRQQLTPCYRHPRFRDGVKFLKDNDKLSCLTLRQLTDMAGGKEQATSVRILKGFPFGKPTLRELQEGPVEAELMSLCGSG